MRAKVKGLMSVKKDEQGNVFTDVISFNSSGNYQLQKTLEDAIWNLGSFVSIRFPDLQEKQFEFELEVKTPDED